MISATTPGTLGEPVAREIRVLGACGHEWTAKTTKAAFIETGQPDKWDRAHVRLYCRTCYREGKPRNNLTPVVAVTPPGIRYCANTKNALGAPHRVRLRSTNTGDLCGACELAKIMDNLAGVPTTEERILNLLGRRDRSAEELANEVRLGVVPMRHMLAGLIDRKVVDYGAPRDSTREARRTTYKLVVTDLLEGAE